jgi:hypothetical protein
MNSRLDDGMKVLSIVVLFMIFITGVLLATWLWLPQDPVRIDKIKIEPVAVRIGEKFCFQFTGEKYIAAPVAVSVELVNGEAYEIMKYSSNTPVGNVFKKRCFVVPPYVLPGRYHIRWSGTYHVNFINDVIKTADSECFDVVK